MIRHFKTCRTDGVALADFHFYTSVSLVKNTGLFANLFIELLGNKLMVWVY